MSWRANEDDDQQTVEAILTDISFGGGAAMTDSPPPVGTPAWFRLRGDDRSPWIAANVIAVSKTGFLGRGRQLVRWKFPEPCPYQVFKNAINGFSSTVEIHEERLPGIEARDWRD